MISTRISEVQSWKVQSIHSYTLLNVSVPSIHIYSYIVISPLICLDSSFSTGNNACVLLITLQSIMLNDAYTCINSMNLTWWHQKSGCSCHTINHQIINVRYMNCQSMCSVFQSSFYTCIHTIVATFKTTTILVHLYMQLQCSGHNEEGTVIMFYHYCVIITFIRNYIILIMFYQYCTCVI